MPSWSAILQQPPFIKHKAMCFLKQIISLVRYVLLSLYFMSGFQFISTQVLFLQGFLEKYKNTPNNNSKRAILTSASAVNYLQLI